MSEKGGVSRRHRARELALRVLFENEGSSVDLHDVLSYHADDMGATADVVRFAGELCDGCAEHHDAIESVVSAASSHWTLPELGKVERAVLRLGTCELLYVKSAPVAVVINESVELAKAYAGGEAASFVNGVLGRVAQDMPT